MPIIVTSSTCSKLPYYLSKKIMKKKNERYKNKPLII